MQSFLSPRTHIKSSMCSKFSCLVMLSRCCILLLVSFFFFPCGGACMHAAVSQAGLWPLCASPQKMSHQCMTCRPVEEHHPWAASSTEAASREDFMAVTCLEIRMGKYEKGFHACKWSREKLRCKFPLHALRHLRCLSTAPLYVKPPLSQIK